jgi:hypothetical protein
VSAGKRTGVRPAAQNAAVAFEKMRRPNLTNDNPAFSRIIASLWSFSRNNP